MSGGTRSVTGLYKITAFHNWTLNEHSISLCDLRIISDTLECNIWDATYWLTSFIPPNKFLWSWVTWTLYNHSARNIFDPREAVWFIGVDMWSNGESCCSLKAVTYWIALESSLLKRYFWHRSISPLANFIPIYQPQWPYQPWSIQRCFCPPESSDLDVSVQIVVTW